MKATIDRSGCIACGICTEICPSVFRMAQDGCAEVYAEDIPLEDEDMAIEAQESCPESVIEVKE